MKSAMKAGEKDRLKVVRLILAAIKQVEVDKRIVLDDAAVLAVIDKMVKQRRDSVEQFEKGNREDLAAIERAEIEVLETYLPEQLTADELAGMVDEIIAAILEGTCTEKQSLQLFALGPEAVKLATLAATKRIADLKDQEPHPSTPSGQIPVYKKSNQKKRKTKRGAKPGHKAARRKKPARINRREEHRCPECPDCGGPLQRCQRKRTRLIEDVPENIEKIPVKKKITDFHRGDISNNWGSYSNSIA